MLLVSPLVAFIVAVFLLSTDYVNNQNDIVTHCDKKPREKVGGSVISVYQALLHLHAPDLSSLTH